MQSKPGSDHFFRPTRHTDLAEIEGIASKYALRVPAGLTSALEDPNQRLLTALNPNGVVMGFVRFKGSGEKVEWIDLIVNPNFMKHEFKLEVLAQAKAVGTVVTTAPGLAVGPWKSFIKEQAPNLGYRVEDARPVSAKSLVLRF